MSDKVSRRTVLKTAAAAGLALGLLPFKRGTRGKLVEEAVARAAGAGTVDKPPYTMVGDYQRFDGRKTAFSRQYWDEASPNFFYKPGYNPKPGYTKRAKDIAAGTPEDGFDMKDMALSTAGSLLWYTGFGFMTTHMWDSMLSPGQKPWQGTPEENAQILKVAAKHFLADIVGVCELNRNWCYTNRYHDEMVKHDVMTRLARALGQKPDVFGTPMTPQERMNFVAPPVDQELPAEMKYVIVCGMEMDYEAFRRSPTHVEWAETTATYSREKFTVMHLAEFINRLGYRAWPFGSGGPVIGIPLAVDAGLGELGRNGLLITPEFGPRQRICGVITDMPLQPDKPIDFGVRKFCEKCGICAEQCPGKALQSGPPTAEAKFNTTNAGVLKWPVEGEACLKFWNANGCVCGNCVHYCPYNKPKSVMHRAAALAAPTMGSLWVRMEKIFGYSETKSVKTWWAQNTHEWEGPRHP